MQRGMRSAAMAVLVLSAGACAGPEDVVGAAKAGTPRASAVKLWEVGSSVAWNRRNVALFRARGGNPGRSLEYLSLAQYRAVRAAAAGKEKSMHPSPAAAAAGASVVVLSAFYPLDAASLEAELAAQREAPSWPGEKNKDWAAGEAIGRSVGAAVLAQAATDGLNSIDPGAPPVGPGYWRSAAPPVRGNLGLRPFFIHPNEIVVEPPPAYGSSEFLAGLAEVRDISDHRTPEQLAIARKWAPFGTVVYNEIAGDLIVKYHLTELEAARVYAYANAASSDALVACFENKFRYWYVRPSMADAAITTPLGLPNHPSYPSAHSCDSGAWRIVLGAAFPEESAFLDAMEAEAADARVFAGLHYRFDTRAGNRIGHEVGRLALERGGLE